ncbi:helix-turn-helix domain-containing protein [Streptomyces erythrochromogenes]|uniref:helix-turn-helix domain-containing protein n=1 Tax=Streptomyces erythrochromogenes TaxID=285574 RepID=UPI00224E5D4C|nr:helix-turn-helix transcriptional regulator [Streptomyces erythrochromogenes]MCX5586030.1 helix-turn-helix transcriptional regulator [Streptomyces erythrochromogenes]
MTDDKRRVRSATQYGPSASAVATNVRRIREARGMSIYALSGLLAKSGRPIAASAVAKIERQERQVTVDDLIALAVALNVSPSALYLPLDDDPSHVIEITGAGEQPADRAWDWADGQRPLYVRWEKHAEDWTDYHRLSRPPRRGRRQTLAYIKGVMEEEGLADGPSVD